MNDIQLETKVHDDAVTVKKDIRTLVEDSAARLTRFQDNVSQATGKAKDDVTQWVGNGVSQVNEGFIKLTGDAKNTVVGAAAVVKKEVGNGLTQYNAKAQEVANKVPGSIGKKAAIYPWVTISIALLVGLFVGLLIKPPAQQPISQF